MHFVSVDFHKQWGMVDKISRFCCKQIIANNLFAIKSWNFVLLCADFKPLEVSAKFYNDIISNYNIDNDMTLKLLRAEIMQWRQQWQKVVENRKEVPTTAIDGFINCDSDFYPVISKLLQILCTLPVSVATAERSFSTLRRLKTWTRSTMGEERLSVLALMHVHRDIKICTEHVLDIFAKTRNTRLDFII